MTDDIDALLALADTIRNGSDLTADIFNDHGVPVRLRIVLAAAVLAAADRPVNKSSIVDTALVARSATYRNHADLLEAARTAIPALVTAMLDTRVAGPTINGLREQLDQAHASIERERTRRTEIEAELRQARAYALELHRKLKPEYDTMILEQKTKVRTLRTIKDPVDTA